MMWTEDMKETLVVLSMDNAPYEEIAKQMTAIYGRVFTKNSCIGMAWKMRAPRRRVIPSRPKGEPVTIQELDVGMCKWPVSENEDPPFMFCGKDADGSWCPEHRERAFTKARGVFSS